MNVHGAIMVLSDEAAKEQYGMHTVQLDPERCWEAVAKRDRSQDGSFVYAVETTGVYCRPSCKSRQPRRENVAFFPVPAAAEQRGFRPCKRCHPRDAEVIDPQAQLAQQVADFIAGHLDNGGEPTLNELGAAFAYDPQHVQRTFREVLGVTPKQYAEALKVARFKAGLRAGDSVLDAGLNAGFSSPSRAYDSGARALGMTPAAYKQGGAGLTIHSTTVATPLGTMLVAATERGVCAVGLYEDDHEAQAALRAEFPRARHESDAALDAVVRAILEHVTHGAALDVTLDVQATAFQWRVWRALQAIPRGETRSYAQIAEAIGEPNAVRAVASACASNKAAIVIPCHRVIKNDGSLSGYKWGPSRKRALLQAERD